MIKTCSTNLIGMFKVSQYDFINNAFLLFAEFLIEYMCLDRIILFTSSTYMRRKYWICENFQHLNFDGFICFELS